MGKIIAWLGALVVALALLAIAGTLIWVLACTALELIDNIRDLMGELAEWLENRGDPDE